MNLLFNPTIWTSWKPIWVLPLLTYSDPVFLKPTQCKTRL